MKPSLRHRWVRARSVLLFGLLGLGGPSEVTAQLEPFDRGPRMRRREWKREDFPIWSNPQGFEGDTFVFTRIRFASTGGFGRWSRWDNDYPDSDLNFSFRLSQLTSLKVDPNGRVLEFIDPKLFQSPFIYLAAPGSMVMDEAEILALRRYLTRGGFMMMDDFWGREERENVLHFMSRVLPQSEVEELKLEHPIFHLVYDLQALPQVPDILAWRQGYTYENRHGDMTDHAPHFLAFHDSNRRLVALLCHNNDLGDGWEREAENSEYFEMYSEKWSYPMGINIIVYAMTH